jgi:ketosteroid isomerase-like protein
MTPPSIYRVSVCAALTAIATTSLGVGCTAPPEAAAIREQDRAWDAAFATKDIDAAVSYFAPAAILMPAHAPAVVGQEAIREWLESWLPNPDVTSTFAPEHVEVAASGDLAYDRGTYHFTMETPQGRIEDEGKYLIVWKKLDGTWKAVMDISNSNLPRPALVPMDEPGPAASPATDH